MPKNKIEAAIGKLLKKGETAVNRTKRKKLIVEAATDSTATDEQMIEREMKRRKAFAIPGAGKSVTPKKKKGGT